MLGARAILNALSRNGYAETAYKVAVQDTYPSWGWWVVNGATTLLENWDLQATRDISDNHMMFGDIGGWFFRELAGIRPLTPGFATILLEPKFIGPEDFSVSYECPYGKISTTWHIDGRKVTYKVTVPPGTTAALIFPGSDNSQVLSEGCHELIYRLPVSSASTDGSHNRDNCR